MAERLMSVPRVGDREFES